MNQFLNEVIEGLSAPQKHLSSKYFYDETGDELFRKIMWCPEYYLTRCEMEIFRENSTAIASKINELTAGFDVIELGAGDASKSIHLLRELFAIDQSLTYYPVDISRHVIRLLEKKVPAEIPGVKLNGLNGEYFTMLKKAGELSGKPKLVMFLGSNIGNIKPEEAIDFCITLRSLLSSGDLLLIGFDLKKDPATIRAAYNDKDGYTRDFNLNLLHRINSELGGNFNVDQFTHWPIYDPAAGSCKSYIVSTKKQDVVIGGHTIKFDAFEAIFMEISQKYSVIQTNDIAKASGFKPVHWFYDSKQWFVDALWQSV